MAKTSFWTNVALQPKRKFRWVMTLGTSASGIAQYLIKSVTRPDITIAEKEHRFISHRFYFPGPIEYQPLSVKIADAISPNGAKVIYDIIRNSGYQIPTICNATTSVSKKKATEALRSVIIAQLDADGKEVERWTFARPWIQRVNFNDLDYEVEDIQDIELTIRYDWAEFEAKII